MNSLWKACVLFIVFYILRKRSCVNWNKAMRIAHRKARKEMFSYLFDFCCLRNGFFPAHVTVKQRRAVGINTCFTWHLATTRKLARIKKRRRCSFNKAVLRLRWEVIYFSFSWKVAFSYHSKFYFPSQIVKVLRPESAARVKVITHHKLPIHSELLAACLVVMFNLYVLRLKSF